MDSEHPQDGGSVASSSLFLWGMTLGRFQLLGYPVPCARICHHCEDVKSSERLGRT